MKSVARFVTRAGKNGIDLMLGSSMRGQTEFKANRVYEIREIMGQLMIVDVGECVVGEYPPTGREIAGVPSWASSINDIVTQMGGSLFLTREEFLQKHPTD